MNYPGFKVNMCNKMPKQQDLVKTTTLENEISHGSFASVVDDTQDEGLHAGGTTPVRGPMAERQRTDGRTSLHHILETGNNNISMITGPFSPPMQGFQLPVAWSSSWDEQRPPDYLFPSSDSSLQIHHILHIIDSVFETLDEEGNDDCLLGSSNETPMAPQ